MNYVIYYRVSTSKQGRSGLGLEAQKASVARFLESNRATEIPPSFTEIESGRKNNRPELQKAIARCKELKATLLIAKLDRLARNAAFILNLKEELERAGADFRALDLPEANMLTISIMAAMAQQESELISKRTKDAIAAGKAKGRNYGNPANFTNATRKLGPQARKRKARENQNNRHAFHYIQSLRESGLSYALIAEKLNFEGYVTSTGGKFTPPQVRNLYLRYSTQNEPKIP